MESKRIFRDERALEVPRVEKTLTAAVRGTPDRGLAERAAAPDGTGPAESPDRATPALASADRPTAPVATTAANAALRRVAERLGEANASISTGDHTIKILALPDILTVGRLRVEARARGEGIAKVSFALNGRLVMKKSKPPYSVELDLGDEPRFHTLRVAALDAEGRELANDEVMVNAGPHRFSVRLLEPRHGKAYRSSVRAHAEVEVPEGERLDRVEFFLNETLVATLFQPPFEQPLLFDEATPPRTCGSSTPPTTSTSSTCSSSSSTSRCSTAAATSSRTWSSPRSRSRKTASPRTYGVSRRCATCRSAPGWCSTPRCRWPTT
jgi:hypothetical protein